MPAPVTKISQHPLAPKRGRAAPIKATPELVAAACDDIRRGMSIESSLVRQGISKTGMDRWRRLNPAVALAFDKAEADFESTMLTLMEKHAGRDTKAAVFLMERRLRGPWMPPTQRTELTGKDGGPVQALTISKVLLGQIAGAPDGVRGAKAVGPTSAK